MITRYHKFAVAASFVLAMAFTFSCSSNDDNDNPPPQAAAVISSSDGSSSSGGSSSGGSSSSVAPKCGGVEYNPATEGCCKNKKYTLKRSHYGKDKEQFCDERDGKTYVYVAIPENGTGQKWMAQNLNYEVEGGKCYGEDSEVIVGWEDVWTPITNILSNAEIQANCDNYGRFYNYITAMDIGSEYATIEFNAPEKHKGICPDGWHIPSNADWNTLMRAINPSCSDENDACDEVGLKLKAWSILWKSNGRGVDDYGFSALPGGYGISGGLYFRQVGELGMWLSSSEYSDGLNPYYYWYIGFGFNGDGAHKYHNAPKDNTMFNVRCVQD